VPAVPTTGDILLDCATLDWLYVMPFKHFEDFSAADVFAVAQELAEVGHGYFQGVKACRCFGESMRPSVVVAVAAELREIEHSRGSPNDVRTFANNVRPLTTLGHE
jgi:glutamine synthetase type III